MAIVVLLSILLLLALVLIVITVICLDKLLLLRVVLSIVVLSLCKFLLLLSGCILLHLLLQLHIGSLLFGQVLFYLLDSTRLNSWFPTVIRWDCPFVPTIDLWRTERSKIPRRGATRRHIVELHVHVMLRSLLLSSSVTFVWGASRSLTTCAHVAYSQQDITQKLTLEDTLQRIIVYLLLMALTLLAEPVA